MSSMFHVEHINSTGGQSGHVSRETMRIFVLTEGECIGAETPKI